MDKTYDPHAIEQRWYQTWEQQGYFEPVGDGPRPYCIMIREVMGLDVDGFFIFYQPD